MKKFNSILVIFLKIAIVLFLGIHLFGVHSRLIFHINPMKLESDGLINPYSFTAFTDENTIGSNVFAMAYALTSVFIVMVMDKKKVQFLWTLILFSIFDGIGVFLFYYIDIPNIFLICALYYAFFTSFIVFSMGSISFEEEKQEIQNKADLLNEMKQDELITVLLMKGETQANIAAKVGVSQSYVSRINSKRHERA